MSQPKITVVIPLYNSAAYINDFVSALGKQTFRDFEAVFVCDPSPDKTEELLPEILKSVDFKYTFHINTARGGVGAARDYALDNGLVRGEFVLFLDGDDGFSPNYLGRLYNTAIENSADMVLCGYKRINRQTMEVVATEMCNNPNRISVSQHEPLLQLVNPAPWNKLIRASVIGDCRFGLPLLEDVIFLTTLLPKCKRVAFVNEPLYDYYVTADSLISANAAQALPVLKNGLCDVANTYRNHPEIYLGFDDYLSAVAFMRVGIGATTRACVSPETQGKRRQIIRQSRRYLDQNFPGWRKNKFLSFRALSKRGLKGVLLWNCRLLYKRHMFGLFIFEYRLFTKLFKKDIKW